MAKAGRGSEQVMIRLPDRMRDRIKAIAERNGRSMNAEIVRALELSFPEPISVSERLDELHFLFSAMLKVRGYDGAIDVITEEIVGALEAGAGGLDPDLDDETRAEMHKALLKWKGRQEAALAARRRAIDAKYSAVSEDE